jgi:hypothetical protein
MEKAGISQQAMRNMYTAGLQDTVKMATRMVLAATVIALNENGVKPDDIEYVLSGVTHYCESTTTSQELVAKAKEMTGIDVEQYQSYAELEG